MTRLEIMLQEAKDVLEVIPQIGLQGPPGTGKTYAAKRLAARLLGINSAAVDEEEKAAGGDFHSGRFANNATSKCWELVQFHPAYGYDDFIRGIQAEPSSSGNSIDYKVVKRRELRQL